MGYQKTLVILKPDALERRLAGRLISRFEDAGLDILATKILHPGSELISDHYRSTEEWLKGVGNKTLKSYREQNLDIVEGFGTGDPVEIGKIVKKRLLRYMTRGSVMAMVLGGNQAITKVRSVTGYTIPAEANPGSIRGDFSSDSSQYATSTDRSVENLVHASGNPEEAEYEIRLWFGDSPVP
jgi:nucleoside-diphosphate kinase